MCITWPVTWPMLCRRNTDATPVVTFSQMATARVLSKIEVRRSGEQEPVAIFKDLLNRGKLLQPSATGLQMTEDIFSIVRSLRAKAETRAIFLGAGGARALGVFHKISQNLLGKQKAYSWSARPAISHLLHIAHHDWDAVQTSTPACQFMPRTWTAWPTSKRGRRKNRDSLA